MSITGATMGVGKRIVPVSFESGYRTISGTLSVLFAWISSIVVPGGRGFVCDFLTKNCMSPCSTERRDRNLLWSIGLRSSRSSAFATPTLSALAWPSRCTHSLTLFSWMAKNAVICCSEFSGLSGAFCGGGRGSAVALFFSCRRPAMSKHVTLVSRRGLQTSLACRKTSYIGFLLRFTCNSFASFHQQLGIFLIIEYLSAAFTVICM